MFQLGQSLAQQLNTQSRLTDEGTNPSNFEGLKLGGAFSVPNTEDFLNYDEAAADTEVDRVSAMAEQRANATRVIDAYTAMIKEDAKMVKALRGLQTAVADNEMSREKAQAQYNKLFHKIQHNRRMMSAGTAADIEEMNVAYGSFEKGLKQRLKRATDVSKGGSTLGSRGRSRMVPFPPRQRVS